MGSRAKASSGRGKATPLGRRRAATQAAERALARMASGGWLTTDQQEVEKRLLRARKEAMQIRNLNPAERFFSTFAVVSETGGRPYSIEIRSLSSRENSCTCVDFRVSGLGTCKHIEAVLLGLSTSWPKKFRNLAATGSPHAEIFLRRAGRVEVALSVPQSLPGAVRTLARRFFGSGGTLLGAPEDSVPPLARAIASLRGTARQRVRLAGAVTEWAADLNRAKSREAARLAFLDDVRTGKRSTRVVSQPLYPYQEEGMLHLAFGERVMLVDDMGLGKTVQAIAACALLRELRGIERVLVVSPASLKTEWEEQIRKFSDMSLRILSGTRPHRLEAYRHPAFFNLANYEQIVRDVVEINSVLSPDVVILDEAQRIKNWSTKTAQAVKKLASPFAFVLTGTPLENRIDEIYSIVEFLDPSVFGPLFRFNREFYVMDERGRPAGYQNLEELRRRIRPLMLRRRKEDVEEQLPARIDNNYFVKMAPEQRQVYCEYEERVAKLAAVARRRPLTKEETDKLMKWLACMRMLCDTTYILDPSSKVCPKLPELAILLEDLGLRNGRKALIFSEWERMLELVRDLATEMKLGFAWHTGSVPQMRRRQEINRFKNDPDCKLFLSTDSGGVGLNLQAASVVVNLDLPWNPARLEQRIARAWRKHQQHAVNVVNLISEDTIEHKMLATLAVKRDLASGIVDGRGDLAELRMVSGREAFIERLKLIMGEGQAEPRPVDGAERRKSAVTVAACPDPRERFRQGMASELTSRVQLIRSRELPGGEGQATLVVVDEGVEQLKPVIARLYTESGQTGRIEVLDRQTFEVLEHLVAMGLASWPREGSTEVQRSSALKRPGPSLGEIRRRNAEERLEQAERKARMARVLAGGDFHREALAALREGIEFALQAILCIASEDGAPEPAGEVPAPVIHTQLVTRGFLTDAEAARVSLVRELATSAGLTDDAARGVHGPGLAIIETAVATVARTALGGNPSERT